jgi:hypothetical protein
MATGPRVTGIVVALLVFLIPVALLDWTSDTPPEIRIIETRGRLSSLIVDGEARMLVIDSTDREVARAAAGSLSAPWEARPTIVIASSDDRAATGLWEILQGSTPRRLLISGVPGAHALWAEIERECARRGVELNYVTSHASVQTERLTILVTGVEPERPGPLAVVVRRGGANVVIALDGGSPPIPGQVLVTSGDGLRSPADLVVTPRRAVRQPGHHELLVGRGEQVRLILEADAIRAQGGEARRGTRDEG